jgi:cyclase
VGTLQHLADGILNGHAAAVLAASIFHDRTTGLAEAKRFLRDAGVGVRGDFCALGSAHSL